MKRNNKLLIVFTKTKIILIMVVLGIVFSCGSGNTYQYEHLSYEGKITKPKEATVIFPDLCINDFTLKKVSVLKRYFSGNGRWEIIHEREKIYAIRKERKFEKYETSLNGFYSDFEDSVGLYQTRVIISFGQYYGFGNNESKITFANKEDKSSILTIEGEHDGTPGNSSYLIIKGKNINIEIFEEAKSVERNFTSRTIKELNDELLNVLKYESQLNETGIIPIESYYPFKPDSTYFTVLDGMQRGIYLVQAGIKSNSEGIVFIKVFNKETNEILSPGSITPKTTREIGWSENGNTIFPYESELTVYEGDWDNQYEARFEIWFIDKNNIAKKIDERSRMIYGWQR